MKSTAPLYHALVLCFGLLLVSVKSMAQCAGAINTFPYQEGFEASNGNWVSGGNASDWAWGTPAKPVISSAASGTKCWIAGSLTQVAYNNNENSTLTSPCFDLTNVVKPFIKFKVFWETEKKYDGASFQYSIDGGNSWVTLGTNGGGCTGDNWYNTSNINTLGSDGWSGNIQPTAPCSGGAGNGSGTWKTAQHEMDALGGKNNVRFRFRFAAGSVCNNYDGFAIDDIFIGEAPTLYGAEFTYNCINPNTVNFAAADPCAPSFLWNFGDPGSGASNSSVQSTPSHVFSAPGQYTIRLTVLNQFIEKTINIIDVNLSQLTGIGCNGSKTGSLQVQVSPAGNYNYQWNTTPVQTTPVITGVGAGSYNITVSGTQTCTSSDFIVLQEPLSLKHKRLFVDPVCGNNAGSIDLQESGGTGPYSFTWTPAVSTIGSAANLSPGIYSIQVVDANNCTDTARFELIDRNPLTISLGNDTLICKGEKLVLNPGVFTDYQWQDNSTLPSFEVLESGNYAVTVTDDRGCRATDNITVTVNCNDLYFPTGITLNGDGKNENFGALGNVAAASNFSLRIFNRWGQLVFYTNDPFKKWDGKIGGKLSGTASFTWFARYQLRGRSGFREQKGSFTVIR